MRYLLIVCGLGAMCFSYVSSRDVRSMLLICGTILLVGGVVSCELVNALAGHRRSYKRKLAQFSDAIESGDQTTAITILTDQGVDPGVARSVVASEARLQDDRDHRPELFRQ